MFSLPVALRIRQSNSCFTRSPPSETPRRFQAIAMNQYLPPNSPKYNTHTTLLTPLHCSCHPVLLSPQCLMPSA
jgi:hypothetical protein